MFDFQYIVHFFGLSVTLNPWKIFGFLGAGVFGLRFLIQWIASERAKKSVIPFGFWEVSAIGSAMMIAYYIHRGEPVGIVQNFLPFPIYLRNLYFRYTHAARERAAAGE